MQDKQYINDKGEVKDIKSLNSFELVNGLSKYSKMLRAFEKEEYTYACKIDQDQCITNMNILKAELLERLDNRTDSIVIPFTENDCEELRSGEEFDWTFTSKKGVSIDVSIVRQEEGEDDDELEDNQIEE